MDLRTRIVLDGVAWGLAFAGLFAIAFAIFADNSEPIEKFKVVDQYENCQVIRYTDQTNSWHYFLKCP